MCNPPSPRTNPDLSMFSGDRSWATKAFSLKVPTPCARTLSAIVVPIGYGLTNHSIGSKVGLRLPTRHPSHFSELRWSPRRSKTILSRCARCGAVSLSHARESLKVKPAFSKATMQRWESLRPAKTSAEAPGFNTRSHSPANDSHHCWYSRGICLSASDQPFKGFPRRLKMAPAFVWAGLLPKSAELVLLCRTSQSSTPIPYGISLSIRCAVASSMFLTASIPSARYTAFEATQRVELLSRKEISVLQAIYRCDAGSEAARTNQFLNRGLFRKTEKPIAFHPKIL